MLRKIPVMVCAVCGVFMAAQYFIVSGPVSQLYGTVLDWMQIIFVCALLVGILHVITRQIKNISRPGPERWYAMIALFGIALMVVLGFGWGISRGSPFLWVFDHVQAPMQTTVFSLLAFYVASAAYRGFRARHAESAVLVLAALIVLLGRVPVGEIISPYVPQTVSWVLNVPAVAAKRAILIGIGLGMTATAIKVIAGMERTYLGSGGR